MTHETKMKLKRDYYAKVKAKAVMCLTAMDVKPKDGVEADSWEGMMSMVEYVKSNHPTAAEEVAAEGAWARWNAADVECGKYKALMEAEEMIAREVAAAMEADKENKPKENGHEEEQPVTEDAPAAVTPESVMK